MAGQRHLSEKLTAKMLWVKISGWAKRPVALLAGSVRSTRLANAISATQ
jgi:hypothetical protein